MAIRQVPTDSVGSDEELAHACRAALGVVSPAFARAEISACFYPYIGLTHTIRRRGTQWVMRISDHCRSAAPSVIGAVAVILASKVLRRRPPEDAVRTYRQFARDPDVQSRVTARRRGRGRKRLAPPRGETHSLEQIFREVNDRFFDSQVEVQDLGWGLRRGWSRLGHYDPVHDTITVNPVLDSPDVPRAVVAFILYHEMLHAVFGSKGQGWRHPPAFRRAERSYPGYREATDFLRRYCRRMRKQLRGAR